MLYFHYTFTNIGVMQNIFSFKVLVKLRLSLLK